MSFALRASGLERPNAEQARLLPPLLASLKSRRWIDSEALLAIEMPWNGRRVDLAVLSRSGVASAFELKVGSFHRVLEQAMYNRLAFDKSWVVVSERPLPKNLEQAIENGVGVAYVSSGLKILTPAARQDPNDLIRRRLLAAFEKVRAQ